MWLRSMCSLVSMSIFPKVAVLLTAVCGLVSCVVPAQGTGSVEALERQAPVTPVPHTEAGDFARAAAHYSNGYNHHRYGNRYRGW